MMVPASPLILEGHTMHLSLLRCMAALMLLTVLLPPAD